MFGENERHAFSAPAQLLGGSRVELLKQDEFAELPPTARPLATTPTVPKAAITASTSPSAIPSNACESQNDTSVRMTSTVTGHGWLCR